MENIGLICSKCGRKLLEMCLCSHPAQYETMCSCGFSLRYFERKDSFTHITQKELDDHYESRIKWKSSLKD